MQTVCPRNMQGRLKFMTEEKAVICEYISCNVIRSRDRCITGIVSLIGIVGIDWLTVFRCCSLCTILFGGGFVARCNCNRFDNFIRYLMDTIGVQDRNTATAGCLPASYPTPTHLIQSRIEQFLVCAIIHSA